MSDRMTPIPFEALLDWVFGELSAEGSIFGVKRFYRAPAGAGVSYMGRRPETAIGPAAGPHAQLAQNIVAAYLCGARIFELKTVQIICGEALVVSKPCILAEDEGYNCEWSTELTVRQAQDEYIKAWFLLHVLAAELELGRADGFMFNMSVGYDLPGIQSQTIDEFLNHMMDASATEEFQHCRQVLEARLSGFKRFDAAALAAVSPNICQSVSVSTMHGCPAAQTEDIALYLMEQKGLDLLLKCNPTLVGYDAAREALDGLGYGYIHFKRESFENDLQYADAVPMLRRLQARAGALGRYFGVKLTNTLPVQSEGALPDETMYLSGSALLPLSLRVAQMLVRDFGGALPISYCGGANVKNISMLRRAGFFPITVCTELLKPGGYGKLNAMAAALEGAESLGFGLVFDALSRVSGAVSAVARNARSIRRADLSEAPRAGESCRTVCGVCASVCPNRANVVISVNGERRMLHIDGMCNECGNCASFCAEGAAPYRDRLTVFPDAAALKASRNDGFAPLPEGGFLVRQGGVCRELRPGADDIPPVLTTVRDKYPWLLYH